MEENIIFTSEMFEDAETYWRNKLSGELVEPGLLGDYARSGRYVNTGHKISFENQLTETLSRISKNNNLLLNVILLSVFKVLIYRYTGQDDIIISSAVLKKSCQGYNKYIALRDVLSPGMTFRELLTVVKETAADGYKYQYYPIRKLIKLLKLENPKSLFKFIFLLDNIHGKDFLEDIINNGENDIVFSTSLNQGRLEGEITYNAVLFKEETIQRFSQCFFRILGQVLSDAGIKLSDIDIITVEEKKTLLIDFNNSRTDYPRDKVLHRLFEESAEQKSSDIALVEINDLEKGPLRRVTYEELNESADRLAGRLGDMGVGPGSIVGLMCVHSTELVLGMLGILKAGGVYLPIDPGYPAERMVYMLKDSNANHLLTQRNLVGRCRDTGFEGEIVEINYENFRAGIENKPERSFPGGTPKSGDPAYIIYTSGSTGRPKGVLVDHKNIIRLFKGATFIDFSREDRLLPTGAVAFDISTFEIWGPLLNGAGLYLYSADDYGLLDPGKLGTILSENKITILHLIPQVFNRMASQQIEMFAGLKYLLVGGDIVRPTFVNTVRARYKDLKMLQMYGPTENTTFTTYLPIEKTYDDNIPIGKPICNSTVYILDRWGNVQPIGAVGELCAGGDGIASGYVNAPGLTAEKFVPNPFVPGERLYKTGDLARWLPDGNIEFAGRIDTQVKIRGFRIELAEIETQLLKKENIREAVVIAKNHNAGGEYIEDRHLCAYIVPGNKITVSELREYLSEVLPDYMLPSYFVFLENLPLTPNGKLDRNALPEPEVETGDEYIAPRNELEEKMAGMWSEVLRIKKDIIGISSNFFELGGNSLSATLLVGRLHQEMNVKLPVGEVFRAPRIMELARYIKELSRDTYTSIEPAEKKKYYLMSSAQKRLYTLRQMDADSTAYNMPIILILEGIPEQGRLKDTFEKLIKRHESFRTSFDIIDKQMVQIIHENVEFEIEYYESDWEKEIEIVKAFERPFDLSRAPLLRAGLIKNGEERHILMIDTHHIAADGFSLGIVEQDFILFYSGEEPPALTLVYKDYSEWQNSEKGKEVLKRKEDYWLEQLEGELPVLNIPTDFPRPEIQGFAADDIDFEIGNELYGILKELSLRGSTTVHILMLAIFNIFLSKLCGQEDIITGVTMTGRTGADLEKIVGLVTNTLVMRSFPRGHKDFLQYLEEVKEKSLNAYENQDYPFEYLVDNFKNARKPGRNPIFDVMFEIMNDLSLSDVENIVKKSKLKFLPYRYDRRISVFDMIWTGSDKGDSLSFTVGYRTDLFKRDSIELMIDDYLTLVKQVSDNVHVKLKDLDYRVGVEKELNAAKEIEVVFKF